MKLKSRNLGLVFRRLKLSDYYEFKKLFYFCFKKNISLNFYEWRYFRNKLSFCYGVFKGSRLIANIGIVSIKLNNKTSERVLSRHSSMVLQKYRGQGIFSDLQNKVKTEISKKINLVAMWPNNNNFANFGIDKKKIIKSKYYLYKTYSEATILKKTENYSIDKLMNFKKYIEASNSFFLKNFIYLKNRYLTYRKKEYFINKFELKEHKSFFILKKNKDKSGFNYVLLDHFGSQKIKSKHLSILLKNQNKLIFLSKNKINNSKLRFLNIVYFKIGFLKQFSFEKKKRILHKKEIYLGDTDIFLTIGKN